MTRGEDVLVTVDYDLFDLNINGETGIFISKSEANGKCLIYIPKNGEWAELKEEHFTRVSPDHVPKENTAFAKSIFRLKITY